MIRVTGIKNGVKITVACQARDGKISAEFDGYDILKPEFDSLIKKQYPIGGTYFPPINSLLNAKNVLENYFFDKVKTVQIDEEIEQIPFEENRVY